MRKLRVFLVVSIVIILLVSLFGCSSTTYDVIKGENLNLGDSAFNEAFYISQYYANRTIGDLEATDFTNYINSELTLYGYEVSEQVYTTDNNKTAKNVIAKKSKEGSNNKIIIGCSWDNTYSSFEAKPDGSYATGTSIAALLTIADYLRDKDLNYNLELIFFAGQIDGFSGAQYYMSKLSAEDKQNIKLFINLGYIIGGDYQYIYARDIETNYLDLITQINEKNEIEFEKVPLFKNTFAATISEEQIYKYSHIGMIGNNIVFMNNKIPSINYQSFNWKDFSTPIYVEKSGMENVAQTSNDTFNNMSKRSEEATLKTQMNNVINSIIDVVYVNQDVLLPVLDDADEINEFVQSDIAYYIFNVAIKIIAVVAIILSVVFAKSLIEKNREEYKKVRDESIKSINLEKDVNNIDDLIKLVEELENETEKNNDKDDKNNDNNNISDDDVFQ